MVFGLVPSRPVRSSQTQYIACAGKRLQLPKALLIKRESADTEMSAASSPVKETPAADVGTVHALEAEQSRLDPSKLIFIETGTSTNMTNVTMLRGCCPRGNPL